MNQTFKRAMSLFMAMAMVLSMVPSFGTHVHAEELETEPVVVTEAPATEAPVVEAPVTEAPATEAPTQAPETEAPATEAPTEPATEAPEVVETEAPEVTEEATEAPEVETEPAIETEPVEETTPDETEETIPEEIFEEELVEEEVIEYAVAATPEGTCTVDGLVLDYVTSFSITANHTKQAEGIDDWIADADTLSGELVGIKGSRKVGPKTTYYYYEATSTLTLTNNSGKDAELSFDYSAVTEGDTYGKITITGVTETKELTMSATGNFVETIGKDETVTIVLFAPQRSAASNSLESNGASISISNLKLIPQQDVTITFAEPENGSYTVTDTTGKEYAVPETVTAKASERFTMIAVPDEGYAFAGWYDETADSYLSAGLSFTTPFAKECTVTAKFLPVADGVYGVGDAIFTDLDIAAQAAKNSADKVVVLLKDATITGSYTIPKGVILLIPYNEEHTLNTNDPDSVTVDHNNPAVANYVPYEKPSAFRTLTMATGSSLSVEGAISVNARHESCVGGQVYGGQVLGKYGEIKMQGNAKITLKNGSNLYAWGYIWGSGTVEALAGATIYEKMQVTDYRGGSNTATIATRNMPDEDGNIPENADRAFPFNQYYIQNVEVEEILHEGAALMAHAAVNLSGENPVEAAVEFIGSDSAMFQVESMDADGNTISGITTISKRYDTGTDRLVLTVNGDENSSCEINGMSLGMGGISINSEMFTLPINGNIDIHINAGAAYIYQELVLQPGVRVEVGENAFLVNEENIYVMDIDQWGSFVFQGKRQQPVVYAPGLNGGSGRTISSDAVIDINGYVVPVRGIFTTAGGAKVISSKGTGVIEFGDNAPEDGTVYQLTGGADAFAIAATAAKLTNGNTAKPFTETKGAVAGDIFFYCSDCDTWHRETDPCYVSTSYTVNWVIEGTNVEIDTVAEGRVAEYNGETPTKEGHTFDGWDFDGNGEVDETQPTVTADASYYAVFTINKYSVTWVDAMGTSTWTDVEYNKVIDTAEVAAGKDSDDTYHYTFSHWEDTDGNKLNEGTTKVTSDVTFTAVYTPEAHTGVLTYKNLGSEGHKAYYNCCQTADEVEVVPHDYTSGTSAHTCICGAVETYTVTVSATENGTVKADKTKATVDTEVYLTVNPVEGYELYSLTYTDAEGDEIEITEDYGNYYFTMPASDVTVTAVFAKPYNVYVAGQQVFDINAADVLGDGKVSYDVATNTLTLNGATIQGVQNDDIQVHQGAGIAYFGDYESNADTLTIKLVGTNTVTALSSTSVSPVGIHVVEADVVITGTGTLNVSAFAPEYTGEYGRQVRCSAIELNNGGLTIESGVTVNATATTEGKDGVYNTAIVATGDITIKGTVNVKSLNADKTTEGLADFIVGIYAYGDSLTIDGAKVTVEVDDGGIVCGIGLESGVGIDIINGAEVTVSVGDAASGDTTGIAVKYDGSINIKKSTVIAGAGNAASGNSSGIAVQGEGAVAIENSTVTAKGGTVVDDSVSHGIGSMGSVTISGSTVTAQGETYGIGAEGNVSISGGTVKATATGTALGYGIGANGTVNIAADVTGEFTGGTMAVGATKGVTHEEGDYEITVKDELADEASKVSSIPAAAWANYDYVKIETHTGVLTYKNLGAEGHKAYYDCCQTEDDVEAESHDYNYDAENHKCVCGAVETYTVTVYNEYGQADEITLSNTTATYGKDYVTTVTSSVGSDVDVWSFILKSDYDNGELWNGSAYDFNANTNTLTIPAKYITGDIMVEVVPYVTVKTHLNGGDVSEDWKYTFEPVNNVITMEWWVGEELYIFPAYDETTDSMLDAANAVFVREGHTVTGYATSANSTEVAYEINKMYTFTEDTELYLIWQCQHAATEAVDNGDGTHDIVCANEDCKAVLKDNEGHDYDNGVCVCEAKQTYTITYDGNGYQFYNYSTGWQKTLTEQASHGDTVTVAQYRTAEYSLELKGNVFAGWNTKADGTGDAYKPGDQISATANLTLYAQWDEIAVGSATLSSGEYVDLNGNVTTTKPEGGYAYYENGKLTMNNYSFNGTGYLWNNGSWQATAAVCYNDETLTIELVGSNSLTDTTYDDSNAIYAWDLTITGTGSLTVTSSNESVLADNLTISGCTVTAGSSNNFGIYCYETLTIDNATVHVTEGGIEAEESITLKGVIVKTPAGGAISEDGTEIVDSEGEFANEVLIAVPRTYNVTFNGTNVTSNGAATFTEGSGDYTAILTAAEGYDLPETVTVKIGTTNTTINVVDGKITIPAANITGNVEITAVGVVKTYTITWSVDGEPYATATVNHGDTITAPETDPTKGEENEYRFKGWEGFTEGMTASGDQTFTANFAELYFVSYSLGVSGGYVGYFEEGETIDYTNLPAVGAYDTETVEKVVKGVAWVTLDGSEKPVVMPAEDITLQLQHNRTGWFIHSSVSGEIYGIGYVKNNVPIEKEGWYELPADHTDLDGDTAWYYIKKTTITTETTDPADEDGLTELTYYFRVSGITRVHYPTEAINGITFGPNAEDAANTEYNYTDATDARFVFDEDGKFQYDLTGFCNEGKNYAVNGQLLWHVGLVTDGTDYYYFVGANEMATGDVYISRNTTERKVVIGGVYTFGADGKLIENNGIVDMTDGSKRYYEDAQLMLGNGLTKVGDNYIYVRSDGTLPVDTTYWVANVNGYDLAAGMYEFDANGYLIIPEADPVKNGIYFEKDAWYYYLNGMKAYNAGLISGTFTWIDADGTETEATAVIYVRSNGALATGKYWITNVTLEGYEKGFYDFDEMGKLSGRQNGIIDGVYYVNGEIQYNAGLIEHNGGLIYVRSNGKVVMNRTYWITNTNGLKPAGCYEFDADGYMIVGTQNGIVKENGKLYYYVGGIKQIGTGLVVYGDSYIYVKTSGELATGAYWVTNVGTTGMEQGLYEFGTDGIMIK